MRQDIVLIEGGIRCPCDNCKCQSVKTAEEVIHDLYMYGFQPNYWIWTNHGEVIPTVNLQHVEDSGTGALSSGPTDMRFQNVEQFDVMQGMISDALGVNVSFEEQQYDDTEELPNEATQRFYNLLIEANKPLYEGSEHSTLSMCVRLLGLKGTFNVPELCIDYMTKMMLDGTPINTGLPHNYYDAKRLVSKLGLGVQRIDCCVQGCMLYYDNEFGTNNGTLTACKFCQEPRYRRRNTGTSRSKPVPRKAMFYLPIITRLQRMFASMQTAGKMTWHYDNRRNSGDLCHPSDGEAWKHFDRVHPDFAADPWNVRLGLCSDGFSPYVQTSTKSYSCWPVIVTPYNLPPDMCMSKPYMFLSCVIPGPTSPTAGIDIYLQPLIDDLKGLWTGVLTYDIARKQNFMMRAALMCTINDFPAYGTLSGWGTHGKLACPICMEDTKAFTLHYDGKTSWFDSHRRFLPSDHPFRKNKNAFMKGVVETEDPPRRLTSQQVWRRVKDLPKVQPINGHIERPDGYGEWHRLNHF